MPARWRACRFTGHTCSKDVASYKWVFSKPVSVQETSTNPGKRTSTPTLARTLDLNININESLSCSCEESTRISPHNNRNNLYVRTILLKDLNVKGKTICCIFCYNLYMFPSMVFMFCLFLTPVSPAQKHQLLM